MHPISPSFTVGVRKEPGFPPVLGRTHSRKWVAEDKQERFMRILFTTLIDGTSRVCIVRPAVRSNRHNTLPVIIDAGKPPIDRP